VEIDVAMAYCHETVVGGPSEAWRKAAEVLRATRVPRRPTEGSDGLGLDVEHHPVDLVHSLVIPVEMRARTSCGTHDHAAVIATSDDTGRSTTGCPYVQPSPWAARAGLPRSARPSNRRGGISQPFGSGRPRTSSAPRPHVVSPPVR